MNVRFTPECENCRSTDLEWYTGTFYLCSGCGELTEISDEEFEEAEEEQFKIVLVKRLKLAYNSFIN